MAMAKAGLSVTKNLDLMRLQASLKKALNSKGVA
jgi:hypothetical protein